MPGAAVLLRHGDPEQPELAHLAPELRPGTRFVRSISAAIGATPLLRPGAHQVAQRVDLLAEREVQRGHEHRRFLPRLCAQETAARREASVHRRAKARSSAVAQIASRQHLNSAPRAGTCAPSRRPTHAASSPLGPRRRAERPAAPTAQLGPTPTWPPQRGRSRRADRDRRRSVADVPDARRSSSSPTSPATPGDLGIAMRRRPISSSAYETPGRVPSAPGSRRSGWPCLARRSMTSASRHARIAAHSRVGGESFDQRLPAFARGSSWKRRRPAISPASPRRPACARPKSAARPPRPRSRSSSTSTAPAGTTTRPASASSTTCSTSSPATR